MKSIMSSLLAVMHFFLSAFGIYDQSVQMGFPGNLKKKDANGLAVVNLPGGGQRFIYFVVDKPSALESPRTAIVDAFFGQLRKLGHDPVSIELYSQKLTRVYKPEHVRPILTQTRPLAY